MKRLLISFNLLFVLLLAAPLFQRMTRLFPATLLYGVEERSPIPRINPQTWFDGTFQKTFERACDERTGFRGQLIKTYNQFNHSLFGSTAGKRNSQVLEGTDDWLYEADYVNNFMRPHAVSLAALESIATDLRLLQDELEKRGIAFCLLISPSKAEVYPEHLPPELLSRRRGEGQLTNREKLLPLLAAHGVRCLDAHAMFLAIKPESHYPLFALGGTHWNHYGAYLVMQELFKTLAPVLRRKPVVAEIRTVALTKPQGADQDIALLLNLWHVAAAEAPTPYPVVQPATGAVERLNLLVVGDSFSFTIIDVMNQARIFDTTQLLYYNKRLYTFPGMDHPFDYNQAANRPVDSKALDWQRVLLNKDAVILEVNEILIEQRGWGFIRNALSALGVPRADGPREARPPSGDQAAAVPRPSPSSKPAR